MNNRSVLSFRQLEKPSLEPVSKFGGQPNWIEEPEWPLDKAKGEKMSFLAQIQLCDELFANTKGKMAYIFFDASEDGETWDPDSGQNAVIVQPGDNSVDTVAEAYGPASEVNQGIENVREAGLCEFKVELEITAEPDYLNEDQLFKLMDEDEAKYDLYCEAMDPSKIGGNPIFIQGEEIPIEGDWKFLCQLDENEIPVYANFGTGVAYAFIDAEGTQGKILWQC